MNSEYAFYCVRLIIFNFFSFSKKVLPHAILLCSRMDSKSIKNVHIVCILSLKVAVWLCKQSWNHCRLGILYLHLRAKKSQRPTGLYSGTRIFFSWTPRCTTSIQHSWTRFTRSFPIHFLPSKHARKHVFTCSLTSRYSVLYVLIFPPPSIFVVSLKSLLTLSAMPQTGLMRIAVIWKNKEIIWLEDIYFKLCSHYTLLLNILKVHREYSFICEKPWLINCLLMRISKEYNYNSEHSCGLIQCNFISMQVDDIQPIAKLHDPIAFLPSIDNLTFV